MSFEYWPNKPILGTQLDLAHPVNKGLEGCWIMNESSGSLVQDLTPNKNHGKFVDGTVWAGGRWGSALRLDGTNDIVQISSGSIPPNLKMGTGNITVSLWITGTTAKQSVTGRIFSVGTNAKRYSTYLDNASGNCAFVIDDAVTKSEAAFTYPTVRALHHVVGVRDRNADKIIVYLDGVEQISVDDNTNNSIDEDTGANIGRLEDRASSFFNGLIHEVRVWRRAFQAEEIQNLYNNRFQGFQPLIDPAVFMDIAVAAGANPHGPLGHPLHGPLAGPIAA